MGAGYDISLSASDSKSLANKLGGSFSVGSGIGAGNSGWVVYVVAGVVVVVVAFLFLRKR